jgi:hypothetical protein
MPANPPLERVAFSPGEFAALFGRSQTWGYRQIYAGKVTAITEHGRILIPAKEVERILGTAGVYNGLKPKVPKKGKKLDGWRQFVAERRKPKSGMEKGMETTASKRLPGGRRNARDTALARLTRNREKAR